MFTIPHYMKFSCEIMCHHFLLHHYGYGSNLDLAGERVFGIFLFSKILILDFIQAG
jgi:hypothetical protein